MVVQVTDAAAHTAARTLAITVSASAAGTPFPPGLPWWVPPFGRDRDRDRDDRGGRDERGIFHGQDFFYGQGLQSGDRVAAYINGLLCAQTKVERSGQWSILIRSDAKCSPMNGSIVAFTLNGRPATPSPDAVWHPIPTPMSTYGYTLTVTGTPGGPATSATFSGSGVASGAALAAVINGVTCGTTTTSSSGTWSIAIASNGAGAPVSGMSVGFTLNGVLQIATPAATWVPGGNGTYALTPAPPGSTAADQLPYQAYGSGLAAGTVVTALNHGVVVGTDTVDATGNWVINVPAAAAVSGDTITFALNGAAAAQTATFQPGGFVLPPGLALTASGTSGSGTFATTPNFGSGRAAQVVFTGGTVDQLQAATAAAGATGAWVQDSGGQFRLLIVGAPAFLKDAFSASFPGGLGLVGVTLIKAS